MESRAEGRIVTLRGVVEGCEDIVAGPRGRARCRKESVSAMVGGRMVRLYAVTFASL